MVQYNHKDCPSFHWGPPPSSKPDIAKPDIPKPDIAKPDIAKPDMAISHVTPGQHPSAASQAVDYVADVTACHLDSEDDPIADTTTEMLLWRCLQHGTYELPVNRSCDAFCPRCQTRMVRNLSEDDQSLSESESDPSTSTA